MLGPREDRISWPDEYMLQAVIASWRSSDPSTQVGAAIVDPETKTVISTGYNGWPRGISNYLLPWDKDAKSRLDNKYAYVVHAEKNAIVNAGRPINGCHLFVTIAPCNECMKDIIQAGLRKIIYLEDPYKHMWPSQAARKMADLLDIGYTKHVWGKNVKSTLQTFCNSLPD